MAISHCQDCQDRPSEVKRAEPPTRQSRVFREPWSATSILSTHNLNTASSATMTTAKAELNELFAIPPVTELPSDVLGELQSILRLHSISPEELSYKWESYTMKMGSEQTKLDLDTARAFKKDLQEMLERESRGKAHVRSVDKRGATPRSTGKGDDVFGM